MSHATHIDSLNEAEVRELAKRLIAKVHFKQATIEKLTHENAVLKRLKFAAQSERFATDQRSVLEQTLEARPAGHRRRNRRTGAARAQMAALGQPGLHEADRRRQ